MRLSSLLSLTFSVGSTPSGVYVRVAAIFEEREEVNGVTEKPTPMDTQKTSFFFPKEIRGKANSSPYIAECSDLGLP